MKYGDNAGCCEQQALPGEPFALAISFYFIKKL
jgi:hypothetical protein